MKKPWERPWSKPSGQVSEGFNSIAPEPEKTGYASLDDVIPLSGRGVDAPNEAPLNSFGIEKRRVDLNSSGPKGASKNFDLQSARGIIEEMDGILESVWQATMTPERQQVIQKIEELEEVDVDALSDDQWEEFRQEYIRLDNELAALPLPDREALPNEVAANYDRFLHLQNEISDKIPSGHDAEWWVPVIPGEIAEVFEGK